MGLSSPIKSVKSKESIPRPGGFAPSSRPKLTPYRQKSGESANQSSSTQTVRSFQKSGIDADIILPDLGTVRVRVQNIHLEQVPHLLIILEDRQQTLRNKALSDAALFGLTERETEVWQLRLRGADYHEISAKLWISQNTVKKHVKNILAKQRSHQDDMEYALMA